MEKSPVVTSRNPSISESDRPSDVLRERRRMHQEEFDAFENHREERIFKQVPQDYE